MQQYSVGGRPHDQQQPQSASSSAVSASGGQSSVKTKGSSNSTSPRGGLNSKRKEKGGGVDARVAASMLLGLVRMSTEGKHPPRDWMITWFEVRGLCAAWSVC